MLLPHSEIEKVKEDVREKSATIEKYNDLYNSLRIFPLYYI